MESIASLRSQVGQELEPSEWFLIDQQRVNLFGEATFDNAWSHTDPVRAEVLGGATVQGMLQLSLISHLVSPHLGLPEGCTTGVNYGFDKVRFINALRVGKRVRARATLLNFEQFRESWWKRTLDVTLDIENVDKPALRAIWSIVYM